MAHQRNLAHRKVTAQRLHCTRHLRGRKSQPVHAAVDLEPDIERAAPGVRVQQRDLPLTVNDACQLIFGKQFQICRFKKTFQQQNRLAISRFTQPYCILDIQQREPVCPGQPFSHTQQSMSIAICLDDSHDARRRRATGDMQIMLQRILIDVG